MRLIQLFLISSFIFSVHAAEKTPLKLFKNETESVVCQLPEYWQVSDEKHDQISELYLLDNGNHDTKKYLIASFIILKVNELPLAEIDTSKAPPMQLRQAKDNLLNKYLRDMYQRVDLSHERQIRLGGRNALTFVAETYINKQHMRTISNTVFVEKGYFVYFYHTVTQKRKPNRSLLHQRAQTILKHCTINPRGNAKKEIINLIPKIEYRM